MRSHRHHVFLQMMNQVKVVPLRTINVATAIAEYSNLFGAPYLRKRVAVTVVLQKVVEDRKLSEKRISYATTPKISALHNDGMI